MAETSTGTSLSAILPENSLSACGLGRGMIFRFKRGRYFRYRGSILGIFFLRVRSISIRLNRPVEPERKGSLRVKRSRQMRGAPLSEMRPERMTLESRKTLTAFFAIGLLREPLPLLPQ